MAEKLRLEDAEALRDLEKFTVINMIIVRLFIKIHTTK